MSKDDRELIERLRGLLAKATPVPWEAQGTQTEGEDLGVSIIGLRLDDAGEPMYTPTNGIVAAALPCPTEIDDNDYTRVEANAALLVAAVNNLPALLTRLEALQAQPVGELRQALERIASAKLVLEKYGDQTPLRCQSCAYRGHVTDEERHSENCPRQIALAALTASPPVVEREAIADSVRDEWLRADWYERWQDATENADDSLMSTLESLRVRVERTILAALSDEVRGGAPESIETTAHLIDDYYEAASNNPCSCNIDENSCRYCNAWERARKQTRELLAALSTPVAQGDEVRDAIRAAHAIFEQATDFYTARNGRRMSIEGDDGEKCWIVPFDAFEELRHALATLTKGARDAG